MNLPKALITSHTTSSTKDRGEAKRQSFDCGESAVSEYQTSSGRESVGAQPVSGSHEKWKLYVIVVCIEFTITIISDSVLSFLIFTEK